MIIIDEKLRGEKTQYDIDSEVLKNSSIIIRQDDKYEYLTGKEYYLPVLAK